MFAGQTTLLLVASDDVRNRDTGAWELAYFPIAAVILALGFALLHGTAAIRRRRPPGNSASAVVAAHD